MYSGQPSFLDAAIPAFKGCVACVLNSHPGLEYGTIKLW
jgi:hypothetical protein